MDAVYFFRHSEADDSELRYSLRGLEQHLPWIRKVWIFGDRPQFLSENDEFIEHIPHEYVAWIGDFRTPMTNFFLMLYTSSLIPGLAPEYLWMCDDFICVGDLTPTLATRLRVVEDLTHASFKQRGLWQDSLWRTSALLSRLGYTALNFESHLPTYYRKAWVLEAWCDFQDFVTEDRWYGILGPTAILNHAYTKHRFPVTYRAHEDKWVGFHGKEPTPDEIRDRCRNKYYLNFDDEAYGPAIRDFLENTFPKPSRYERPSMPQQTESPQILPRPAPSDRVRRAAYPQEIIKDHRRFGSFLNDRGLLEEGALVGIFNGHFAEILRRDWKGDCLHCVDAWLTAKDDSKHIDKYNFPQWKCEHMHNEAHRRLDSFAGRINMCRMRPGDAAKLFEDESLSFVYIHDKHYFEAVWDNLEIWSRKVRPGGILAGHDYLDGMLPSGFFEVKTAVDTWADRRSLKVYCTGEEVWRSWIIEIPQT